MNNNKVDHTCHDYSCYLEQGGPIPNPKKAEANFPAKLHRMLSDDTLSDIITWMVRIRGPGSLQTSTTCIIVDLLTVRGCSQYQPHGRSFKILEKKLLVVSSAAHEYFGLTKYESFTRQLSGWGFKRLHRPGSDFGSYYHPVFLRGLPTLTR